MSSCQCYYCTKNECSVIEKRNIIKERNFKNINIKNRYIHTIDILNLKWYWWVIKAHSVLTSSFSRDFIKIIQSKKLNTTYENGFWVSIGLLKSTWLYIQIIESIFYSLYVNHKNVTVETLFLRKITIELSIFSRFHLKCVYAFTPIFSFTWVRNGLLQNMHGKRLFIMWSL